MAKKKKEAKTNAARILDTLGISYELKTYEVDENDLSAVHVAESVGMPIEMVYKTLVCRGDKNGVLMAVIPGGGELDLKALAAASGNKRVEMVHLKEVFGLTGYIRSDYVNASGSGRGRAASIRSRKSNADASNSWKLKGFKR